MSCHDANQPTRGHGLPARRAYGSERRPARHDPTPQAQRLCQLLLRAFVILCMTTTAVTSAIAGELAPAPLFTDGLVLQRDLPVAVWGAATPGEKVTVEFAGQSKSTTADASARWQVTLDPLRASDNPRHLTIRAGQTVTIRDVLVGEVWICSGQSNMFRRFAPASQQQMVAGWEDAVARADYPTMRYFNVEKCSAPANPSRQLSGRWITCTPQTAINMSAVAHFFARDLQKHLGVPVGIIVSAVGGTPIEAWMSREALGKSREANPALATGKRANYEGASGLFNGMIAPLVPFTARGFIWYQGESNRDEPQNYQVLLTSLINDWRVRWQRPDMPFLFVQLPPHKSIPPELREAQRQTQRTIPGTAMVTIIDHGDAEDIHPPRKEPVGQRLALAARSVAHEEPVIFSGPSPARFEREDGGIVILFDSIGGGLHTADNAAPRGFELAGPDGVFHPADATLRGDRIFLRTPAVPEPAAVRHGWANVPDINLVNTHGLPAGPFTEAVKP